jgi:hypothetical protein
MSVSPLRDTTSSSKFVLALQSMVADASEGGDLISKTSIVHRSILQGGFAMLKENISWHTPKWKLHVYISSLGGLQGVEFEELAQELRVIGKRAGVEVTLIDAESRGNASMCFWDECEQEIDRCRKQSTGLFFISYHSGDR